MAKIVFSEFVEKDLDVIWEYIAYDNVVAAERFLEAADHTFQELAKMPHMGRKRNFPSQPLRDLRSFRIKDFVNYLIFYFPVTKGIHVLHVLHGAVDLDWFWGNETSAEDPA